MRRVSAVLIALVASEPALALSCLPPDPLRSVQEARSQGQSLRVLTGRLSTDEPLRPPASNGLVLLDSATVEGMAQFSGLVLSPQGGWQPLETAITLSLQCFGEWCGSWEGEAQVLALAQETDAGLTITLDPCGTQVFPEADLSAVHRVEICLVGGLCALAERP